MRIRLMLALFCTAVVHEASARWAELNFTPGKTNEFGFTVSVVPSDAIKGIQFTITISSAYTNQVPRTSEQVHVIKLSAGELPASQISVTNGPCWSRFVFVIPSADINNAEFMWSRGYEGFYKKLGGSFHRVSLKRFYDYHRAKNSTEPPIRRSAPDG